ncbi:SDR family oxidoreductase [Shewanella sp. ULN5]|uniref:UDP-glucose 4-epimerase family protein n=1 Tax=Shewanella sp. ULN5 TaxID=2994678 RepID=UPI00274014BF|nr:SDR family oxidoreductase [Shewanella sp. ULN5]MDP5145067.1 SDR family oxidoreductase [Shewanella sp. ULN5]
MNQSILLTGASGFIGRTLAGTLCKLASVKVLGRKNPQLINTHFVAGDVCTIRHHESTFDNVSVVIHCAARVHIMNDKSSDSLCDFRNVNTLGTLNLAKQSVANGVKRFIFISSIKVNGESTLSDIPFTGADARSPEDFYGQSKSEAEEQLLELAKETGLEVVIIRPTLVYGPGVKANFASLLKLVSKGLPLPFGCIKDNKRSLVSVKNLVDLIITCIDHPKAANQVFLVSDDHDVSTASMVKHMSHALGKSSRLLPVPLWCYRLVGKLSGKTDVVDRLLGSLQVDISHTKDTLGWVPPQTLEQGFKETAESFLLNKNK